MHGAVRHKLLYGVGSVGSSAVAPLDGALLGQYKEVGAVSRNMSRLSAEVVWFLVDRATLNHRAVGSHGFWRTSRRGFW